jgi:hypothetical protein
VEPTASSPRADFRDGTTGHEPPPPADRRLSWAAGLFVIAFWAAVIWLFAR